MDKSIDTLLLHFQTVHKKKEHPMFYKDFTCTSQYPNIICYIINYVMSEYQSYITSLHLTDTT